eukprot:jgi/Bigna1/136732/aug1.35_g11440
MDSVKVGSPQDFQVRVEVAREESGGSGNNPNPQNKEGGLGEVHRAATARHRAPPGPNSDRKHFRAEDKTEQTGGGGNNCNMPLPHTFSLATSFIEESGGRDNVSDFDDDEEEEEGLEGSATFWKGKLLEYRRRFRKLWALHAHMRTVNEKLIQATLTKSPMADKKTHPSILAVENMVQIQHLKEDLVKARRETEQAVKDRDGLQRAFEAVKQAQATNLDDVRRRLETSQNESNMKEISMLRNHVIEVAERVIRAEQKEQDSRNASLALEQQLEAVRTDAEHYKQQMDLANERAESMQKTQIADKERIEELKEKFESLGSAWRSKAIELRTSEAKRVELQLKLDKTSRSCLEATERAAAAEAKLEIAQREMVRKDKLIEGLRKKDRSKDLHDVSEKAAIASEMIQACMTNMNSLQQYNSELTHELEGLKASVAQDRDLLNDNPQGAKLTKMTERL